MSCVLSAWATLQVSEAFSFISCFQSYIQVRFKHTGLGPQLSVELLNRSLETWRVMCFLCLGDFTGIGSFVLYPYLFIFCLFIYFCIYLFVYFCINNCFVYLIIYFCIYYYYYYFKIFIYFSKTERQQKATVCFKKSLSLNPLLWKSYERLCQMGKLTSILCFFILFSFSGSEM